MSTAWVCGIKRLGAAFALLAMSAAAAGAQDGSARDVGAWPETIVYGGLERSYWVSDGRGDAEPAPLLVALHGFGGDGERLRARMALDALVGSARIVMATPEGLDGGWNDGRVRADGGLLRRADDVGFLTMMIRKLVQDGRADPERVFVVGVSNGGMMALRLACERAPLLAGVAAIIANQPVGPRCPETASTPMLFIHGERDSIVPYVGGEIGVGWGDNGAVLSAPETIAFWAERNGCDGTLTLRDRDAVDDDTRLESRAYQNCDAPLRHLVAFGAGHTVPSEASSRLRRHTVGRTTEEIDAAEAVWSFFATLSRS